MKHFFTSLMLLFIVCFSTNGQDTVKNYTDINGMKQGYWLKKNIEGEKLYEGSFNNNVPIGKFLRFHKNGIVKAELVYDSLDQKKVTATLFDDRGELAAKGFYHNKTKDGKWYYYGAAEKLIAEEPYINGKLDGVTKKYYPSGKIVETKTFKNGMLHGEWFWYYEDGQIRMKTMNKNDKRTGDFLVYYPNGNVKIKGSYKNDYKEGKWVFYTKKGEVDKKIVYVKDIAENQVELDAEMSKELKEMDAKKGQIADPKDHAENPYEYMKNQTK